MKTPQNETFQLKNFEGPLDLLWHLVHQQEIDIYEVPIHEIIQQYLANDKTGHPVVLSREAEFIALTASFIYLKSVTLLPVHALQAQSTQEEDTDPQFEIIHHLLDYCRFKQAAKSLVDREEQQTSFHPRGIDTDSEIKKNLGIAHLSLDDLAALFQEILSKMPVQKSIDVEETWRVSDKIKVLRYLVKEDELLLFHRLFTAEKSREELIVTFLALLELMKTGEIRIVHDHELNAICIYSTSKR